MGFRRERPPVIATISSQRPDGRRRGSLGRDELAAFSGVLEAVEDARALLVTGDRGRSSVALGIATVAAARGTRVALVECDLAVPTLAGTLGIAGAPGLHEYLRGQAEAADVLQPLVLAGPASREAAEPLVCVTAGAATAEGPTLLDSERFRRAFANLRSAYELLVLDGPPFESDYSLRGIARLTDAALACVSRPLPRKRLPVPVVGLVTQP